MHKEKKQQLRRLLQKLQDDTLNRNELGVLKNILDCHGNEDEITEILEEYWEKEQSRKLKGRYDRCILEGKYFYIIHKN